MGNQQSLWGKSVTTGQNGKCLQGMSPGLKDEWKFVGVTRAWQGRICAWCCMKFPVGPYFFKLWYKLHGNIPFQYTHLTCECGHGQMCHAKQRLATDHCSLRGLWFT